MRRPRKLIFPVLGPTMFNVPSVLEESSDAVALPTLNKLMSPVLFDDSLIVKVPIAPSKPTAEISLYYEVPDRFKCPLLPSPPPIMLPLFLPLHVPEDRVLESL